MIVREIKLHKEELAALVLLFVKAIIILDRGWRGKQIPSLNRLFPCDIIALFQLWYKKSQGVKAHIVLDEERFLRYFEKLLLEGEKKYERVISKSAYNQSQGEYKYQFNSLRLTKQGLELYLNLL